MRCILPFTPLDLVNLLLDFERFQVIELGLVRLEFGIELVFTSFFLRLYCQHDSLQ